MEKDFQNVPQISSVYFLFLQIICYFWSVVLFLECTQKHAHDIVRESLRNFFQQNFLILLWTRFSCPTLRYDFAFSPSDRQKLQFCFSYDIWKAQVESLVTCFFKAHLLTKFIFQRKWSIFTEENLRFVDINLLVRRSLENIQKMQKVYSRICRIFAKYVWVIRKKHMGNRRSWSWHFDSCDQFSLFKIIGKTCEAFYAD